MTFLCAPATDIMCFGCCPPIRPAHYDHLDYVGSLRREFMDNRIAFLRDRPRYRPIRGYSCWALGFLDVTGRKVGCLLHPQFNKGEDLRHLIDYGNKCRRESCSAAQVFALLPPEGQDFLLPLVRGMNSFYFSSPKANPLFHLLLWGPEVLEPLRVWADSMDWAVTELIYHQPFLLEPVWKPKAHRYLFRLMLPHAGPSNSDGKALSECCTELLGRILSLQDLGQTGKEAGGIYTHLLPLPHDFLDFLRLGLGLGRCSLYRARELDIRAQVLASEVS